MIEFLLAGTISASSVQIEKAKDYGQLQGAFYCLAFAHGYYDTERMALLSTKVAKKYPLLKEGLQSFSRWQENGDTAMTDAYIAGLQSYAEKNCKPQFDYYLEQ